MHNTSVQRFLFLYHLALKIHNSSAKCDTTVAHSGHISSARASDPQMMLGVVFLFDSSDTCVKILLTFTGGARKVVVVVVVVVVDDEASIRHVLTVILKNIVGHTVLSFADARPALDEVDFSKVDLVITDLRMTTPGDEFIQELRGRGIDIPIILLCGVVDDELITSLDVQAVIPKPFELKELIAIVDSLL